MMIDMKASSDCLLWQLSTIFQQTQPRKPLKLTKTRQKPTSAFPPFNSSQLFSAKSPNVQKEGEIFSTFQARIPE
jgi:hypothetical protein